MNRAIKSGLSAAPYIIFLVLAPILLPRYIPPWLTGQLEVAGMQLQAILTTLMALGVILATLSILKNMSREWFLLKPIASALGSVVGIYLVLYLIGFGNPSTFGLTNFGVPPSAGVPATLMLDLRFIVLLGILIAALKIVHTFLKFNEARKERLRGLTLQP